MPLEDEDHDARPTAVWLSQFMSMPSQPGPPIEVLTDSPPDGHIVLDIRRGSGRPESYDLTITATSVTLHAEDAAGLFYGVQTLRQLLPYALEHRAARPFPLTLPAVRIADAPRFPWRGAMLDVARHFFTVEDVKRYIDLLAMLKLNRLHLHLADDQGWRVEIKSWPRLTTHGGSTQVGGGPGGFYTQTQYAEIVRYAAERFVTIVPEIDMPGHTNAALSSYPELNCNGVAPPLYTGIEVGFSALCVTSDVTYRFIDDVVRELAALTPGRWVHIGGDEVKTLAPEDYQRFIERVQGIVAAHGKDTVGWDEIAAAPLLPATIVQHWRPKTALERLRGTKTRLIMSPADRAYLDMKYDAGTAIGLDWAGLVSVQQAYDWDPQALAGEGLGAQVIGVEGPLWSETLATIRDVEFLAFPRLAAIAEVAWSAQDRRSWDGFRGRLAAQGRRWSAMGINFHRAPGIDWAHQP